MAVALSCTFYNDFLVKGTAQAQKKPMSTNEDKYLSQFLVMPVYILKEMEKSHYSGVFYHL